MTDSVYRCEAWLSGHVQGVGFRYSTTQIARGFEVTGAVKNLADGRVHILAEGKEEEVREFIAEVKKQMADYIRESEEEEVSGRRAYSDFHIEH
jgi:acylphosphatase